jgi:hypothetical protein
MDIFNKSTTFLKTSLTKAGQHLIKTTIKPNVEGK